MAYDKTVEIWNSGWLLKIGYESPKMVNDNQWGAASCALGWFAVCGFGSNNSQRLHSNWIVNPHVGLVGFELKTITSLVSSYWECCNGSQIFPS